jgi:glycosyltransferase involved in cell wall biosynthesis
MTIRTTLTAVIPAYNEAKRIGKVLEVLRAIKQIDDILVIDDGSKDGTAQQAKLAAEQDRRIRIISHPRNLGKGQTFFTARSSTRSTFFIVLDADLIHLSEKHITDLIQPVLQGKAEMTTAVFRGGRLNTDMAHYLTPWLSGQRCFRSDLLNYTSPQAASGYGIETAITIAARQKGWRCLYIPWSGVTHPPSESHRGLIRGTFNRGKMYAQIIRALVLTLGWKRAVDFVLESKLSV